MMLFRRPSALLLLAVIVLGVASSLPVTPVAAATGSVPFAISVRAAPSTLPADGGMYPVLYVSLIDSSGTPTLATGNVTIFLSTSSPAVGSVLNSSIVIHAGESYAVADFQTTPTSGSTTITATATGYATGTVSLSTSVARGYPFAITLTAVPSEVNSTVTSSRSGTVIVEFQDPAGQPAKAVTDTLVSVYSSNPRILSLNASSFTMRAGQLLKVLSFTTGVVPGSAVITASASQLSSGTAQVSILGKPPLAISLFVQPTSLVTSSGGRLVIAITDLNGNPTRAPSNILVQISSSSTSTVSAPPTATIPAGQIYAAVTISAGSTPGSATITVSSSGLESGFVQIKTYNARGPPSQLELCVGPNTVLADNGDYSAVVVGLLNSTGYPTVGTSSYSLTLTSSHNSSVGGFGQAAFSTMNIPSGASNVVWATPFTSTFVVGTTSLTVSAQNLLSAIGSLSTFGPVPSRLAIIPLFSVVPADGASHPALQVSLEDSSGSPAVAPSDVTVYLQSSQSAIAQVSSPVTVPAGGSAVVVDVTTSSVSGSANMTAYTYSLGSGYASASASITSVRPSPAAIGATLAPATLSPSVFQKGSNLVLQLQDGRGNPAKARVPTLLTVTSSNAVVYNGTLQVEVSQGASYVVVPIVPLASGSTTLTITSAGLATATVQFQVLSSPFALSLVSSTLTATRGEATLMTLTVTLDGVGVNNANVTWSTTLGPISPPVSTTSALGTAVATFVPAVPGIANVTAVVATPYGPPQRISSPVLVTSLVQSSNQSLPSMLLSFPYVLVLVGVVAVAVILVFLLIRRRRRAAEAEGAIGEEAAFNYYGPPRGFGSTL